MRTFDAVLPYLKKSYTRILGGLVMLILVDLVQLAVPKVMQYAIDHIQERTIDYRGLAWIGLIIFGCAIAVMVLRYFWRILIICHARPSAAARWKIAASECALWVANCG